MTEIYDISSEGGCSSPSEVNQVYMDAMQHKQKSIGDEWAVIEIASLVHTLWVDW